MNEDEKRGRFLSELRKRKHMTQQDLAEMIHYTDKNISKWETGKSFPSNPNVISKLADIFEVSIEEIMYGEFKQENNIEEMNQNFKKEYVKSYNRYIKMIKTILLFVSFFIIISFMMIYLIYIRNSVKLYSAEIKNSNLESERIMILLTTKLNILSLEKLKPIEKEIQEVKLYFEKDGKERLIFSGENQDYYIKDNHGYNEYHLEEVIHSHGFLFIQYFDGTSETIELKFKKEYYNDNIFPKDKSKSSRDSLNSSNQDQIRKFLEMGFEDKGAFLEQELSDSVTVRYDKTNEYLQITILHNDLFENIRSNLLEDEIRYEKMEDSLLLETKNLEIHESKNCREEECHTIEDYAMYIHFLKKM